MTVFEKIQSLAKKKGIAMSKLALTLGFSENLFYRWKTSDPKAIDLEKVADYFDVSVDYLLGRTDDPNLLKTENENTPPEFFAIQRKSKKLNRSDQARLLKIMEATFDDNDSEEFEEDTGDDL